MRLIVVVVTVFALLAVATLACVPKGSQPDETNTRLVQVSAPSDATGSGWVDIYVPAKEPGAEHFSCFLEPGSFTSCERYVDPSKPFEVVATPKDSAAFIEWLGPASGGCSDAESSCGFAAGAGSISLGVLFKVPTSPFSIEVRWEEDWDWVYAQHPGRFAVFEAEDGFYVRKNTIPFSELAAGEKEVWSWEVPAGSEIEVQFTAELTAGVHVELFRFELWPPGTVLCESQSGPCGFTLNPSQVLPGAYLLGTVELTYSEPYSEPDVSSEPSQGGTSPQFLTPATPAPVPPAPTSTSPAGPNLSGNWTLRVDVTRASGACADEEDDPVYTETVSIAQSGTTITVTGIDGATGPWQGSIQGNQVTFSGTKRDGSGNTSAVFNLTYNPATGGMTGTEAWTWTGNSGTCPNGASSVVATRS
jgi:hypothetical protein